MVLYIGGTLFWGFSIKMYLLVFNLVNWYTCVLLLSMCINDYRFNNGDFDLKSIIAKIKLCQI